MQTEVEKRSFVTRHKTAVGVCWFRQITRTQWATGGVRGLEGQEDGRT